MINQDVLRVFLRKYREAELPQLANAMEDNLMELLSAYTLYGKRHNDFVGAVLFQCREDMK